MRNFFYLSKHWPVLALAFFIGASLAFPAFWSNVHYGISMRSPTNIRSADEFFYLARIKDVTDGYPLSGNPFIREYKSSIPGQPVFMGEYLSAYIIRMAGFDVVRGNTLLDFILPIIAVIFSYFCLFAITQKRWLSLLGTAILFLVLFPGAFARTPSPQLDFIFWLSLFYFLHLLINRGIGYRTRYIVIGLSAINLGILFYLYTYYWTFYFALLGIAFLVALVARSYEYAKDIIYIAGGGLIIAIPYFLLMRKVIFLPEYVETVRRIGMINSHFPSGIAIVLAAFFLIGLTALLRKYGFIRWNGTLLFFVCGAAATVLSVNQHIITGKNLEFSSHYYMLSVFWFVFYAAYLIGVFFQRTPRFEKMAIGVASAVLVFLIPYALFAKVIYSTPSGDAVSSGRYLSLLDWVDKNTAKDSVIYAPAEISQLIPIYTADNVFWAPFTQLTMMADSEVMDRFVLGNFFQEPFDSNFVESNIRSVYGVYFIDVAAHNAQENRVRSILGLPPKPVYPVPQAVVAKVLARYNEIKRSGFEEEMKHFRVDYFIWDAEMQRSNPFDKRRDMSKVYTDNKFIIYRVR